ncbi:MAG: type IV pilus modification PilV family protein [Opitutales bacterium]
MSTTSPLKKSRTAGFNLIEVMIALGIFGFVSIGIAKGIIQLRVSSRALTIEQAVDEAVHGYIAQIKAQGYDSVSEKIVSWSNGNPTNLAVKNNYTLTDPSIDEQTLSIGNEATHQVLVYDSKTDAGFTPQPIDLHITLSLSSYNNGSDPKNNRRFIMGNIDYRWKPPLRKERTDSREFIIGDNFTNVN